MSKNMRTACFSLSLSLRQPARPVGRAFLHTTTVIVTSLVHQWRPLSFSLSLTHDACCLSWFPFCSSFCHVHCCCYGRERERERERYLYVEQVRERKKENWLHVPYLEVDYSIATYKIEIGIKVFFGFCPLLEHHPIHLLSVRWAEAELGVLEGVWEGGPWDIRPCPTPYRIFTKKVFLENRQSVFGDKIERLGNYENEQKMKSALAHRLRSCPSSECPPFKSRSSLRLDVLGQCVRWTKLEAFLILCREIMNYHKCSIGERWRWWWYEREKGNNGLCPAFRGGGQFHLQDLYLIDVTRHLKKYFW